MTERDDIRLIALVGMPGAGKTEAVEYLVNKGWPNIYFGGIMYEEMRKAGIQITAESQQIFREQLRAREGKDFIAKRAIERINNLLDAGQRNIVLDGIYSWSEYKLLKSEFHKALEVVAIVAPRKVRYHRLANRPERPFTTDEAMKRDYTEIENIEKGGPIAIADHYIINDETIDALHEKIDKILSGTFAE